MKKGVVIVIWIMDRLERGSKPKLQIANFKLENSRIVNRTGGKKW